MKRFYLGLCLIASLILGTACTENLEEGGNISTTNEESPYVVSKDLACQIASSLSQRGSSVLRSAAQDFQGKTVATALSVADDYSEPVMHVINYEGGGFVIIAGDNRMDPILAYSETGSFPSVDEWDLPYGLTLWMHAQEDLASFYRENNMEQDPAAKYAWDKLMGIETVSTKAVDPVEPCEEGDFEMIADVGPFLETEWDQESHFNDLLPMMTCNGVTKHYLLDFHHLDPLEKENTISRLMAGSYSITTVLQELKKCVCLCSNCHREFHWLQANEGLTIESYLQDSKYFKISVQNLKQKIEYLTLNPS